MLTRRRGPVRLRAMATLTEIVRGMMVGDPDGSWLRRMLEQLEDVHWGALRAPGHVIAGPGSRDVPLVDGPVTLPCLLETDTLLLALEDARTTPLATGTTADPKRHRVSRVIEALRTLARDRARTDGLPTDPLFGVVIVGGTDCEAPHRTTILEGLPHIEREQAEDLYAACWGVLDAGALETLATRAAEPGVPPS